MVLCIGCRSFDYGRRARGEGGVSMSKTNAFPMMPSHTNPADVSEQFRGLTKREYFAAFAMLGHFILNERQIPSVEAAQKWAEGSVFMADIMLAELEREKEGK